jgi:hypothetical protein
MGVEIICKACDSHDTKVIESRLCNNGTRRRRYRCLSCDCRWTHWDGARPTQGLMSAGRSVSSGRGRQTTEEEVKRILLALPDVSNVQLARAMNFSPEWVRRIRTGLSCIKICPELMRRTAFSTGVNGRSCHDCFYWTLGCDFGFPDPYVEGPGYANDCDLFKLRVS